MTDESDDQTTLLREITTELAKQCVENGLEPLFSIEVTDQTGYTVSALYISDQERGGIKFAAAKALEDESGELPPHTFVFPLKVHASDHRGNVSVTRREQSIACAARLRR